MAHHDKHGDEQGSGQAHHGHGSARYFIVWIALLVFTALTVFTAQQDLGGANLPLAVLIATIKAVLVVLFFMHLWDSEGINRLVFGVSVVFVVVLLLGVFGDLFTRQATALPTGIPPTEEEAKALLELPAPPPHHGHGQSP